MSELTTLGPLKFIQPKIGYRHGIDSVLLANFVEVSKNDRNLLDVGSGDGIISIILKYKFRFLNIYGVEIQEKLWDLSIKNAELNNLEINFIHKNIFSCKPEFPPQYFDIIVCNPPYFPLKNGKLSKNKEKTLAKHEIYFTIDDFFKISKYFLKPNCKIFLIYPYQRFLELIEKVKREGLFLKKIRFIHNDLEKPSNLILFEITNIEFKIPIIEKPLIIYKDGMKKEYTDEVAGYLFLNKLEENENGNCINLVEEG